MLYGRTLVTTVVGLYTARVMLQALGVTDLGIYNVVAGVLGFMSMMQSAMGLTLQRFLNYDIGRGDHEGARKDFAACFYIYLAIAVIIVILGETIGLWFVNHKLVIPPDRMVAANWVYQFTILSTVVSLLQTPYSGLLTAHENMGIQAWVSIINAFVKLFFTLIVLHAKIDHLILYCGLMFLSNVSNNFFWVWYVKNRYSEHSTAFDLDKNRYRKLFTYAVWNMIGPTVGILNAQGQNVMLNLFFGPAVNAARSIASNIATYTTILNGAFYQAIRPQIVKYYAVDDIDHLSKLIFYTSKMAFFLTILVSIPVFVETPTLIQVWLGQVPDYVVSFTRLHVLIIFFDVLSNPLMGAAMAKENVKWYSIGVSAVYALSLPLSWVVLKITNEPNSVYYAPIVITIFAVIARLYYVKKMLNFSYILYVQRVLIWLIPITVIGPILHFALIRYFDPGIWRVILLSGACFILNLIIIYWTGFNSQERSLAKHLIETRLRNLRKRF